MNTELTRVWNSLDRDDKLEIIENGIDMCSVSEGFLMLRLFKKGNEISSFISNTLENHLCVEVVSKSTLSELFSDEHDFEEEDAEVILKWMESQK
mgnify:CR=1 FL=1|tara:strand:+ start:9694 stop:9978 length:285 start_codon:yes stop_codon:yes gene_type:complete